jgi:hypothetical protein
MFEDIIKNAPKDVKNIFEKDPRLTFLLKTMYEVGRVTAQHEIAKYIQGKMEIDKLFMDGLTYEK